MSQQRMARSSSRQKSLLARVKGMPLYLTISHSFYVTKHSTHFLLQHFFNFDRYKTVHPFFFYSSIIDPRTKENLKMVLAEDDYVALKDTVLDIMVEEAEYQLRNKEVEVSDPQPVLPKRRKVNTGGCVYDELQEAFDGEAGPAQLGIRDECEIELQSLLHSSMSLPFKDKTASCLILWSGGRPRQSSFPSLPSWPWHTCSFLQVLRHPKGFGAGLLSSYPSGVPVSILSLPHASCLLGRMHAFSANTTRS